eukprot:1844670-Prymnesium_polylepis.1
MRKRSRGRRTDVSRLASPSDCVPWTNANCVCGIGSWGSSCDSGDEDEDEERDREGDCELS